MGRSWSFSKAWERNEAMVRRMDREEGHYEGVEKAASSKRKIGPQQVEWESEGALGLDSELFHIDGEPVTNLKEEYLGNGHYRVYWQKESGGTYVTEHEKTAEGRHTQTRGAKRIFSF